MKSSNKKMNVITEIMYKVGCFKNKSNLLIKYNLLILI